jgi:cyclic pyranopterin phosphate synthase
MPAEGVPATPRSELLSFEEIARVARLFRALGVETIRLTGGEPLLRRGLPELVRMIRGEGIDDVALTTNATLLERYAAPLKEAGLTRINVSLDSLDPEVFRELTRGGDLARVRRGLDAARDAGFAPIKLNTVVVRGRNDHELADIVAFAFERDFVPRFIELMPLGAAAGAALGASAVVSLKEMKARLSECLVPEEAAHFGEVAGRGPAGYLRARDGSGRRVGFIGAVTENFCERCNRVRVTASGQIRACLASPNGLSLRDLLRGHAREEALLEVLRDSLFGKREGHYFHVENDLHLGVSMSGVGG